jgi:hypothetical protein
VSAGSYKIGDTGARALAKALESNCTLTTLDLSGVVFCILFAQVAFVHFLLYRTHSL